MRLMKGLALFIAVSLLAPAANAGIADFEDLGLSPESYWNGSDDSGGFTSGLGWFNNSYTDWGGGFYSWGGFGYSNITDTATGGIAGQYNAITGAGQGGSANYAVAWVDTFNQTIPTVILDSPGLVGGLYVTNNNYAYYSMLNGDIFCKKFGGETGDDPDWFLLTITGKDFADSSTGTVDFYLADYQFADNGLDYIVDTWQWVDLTSLGMVKSLEFTLSSSDAGQWGMNTPAYFAIDTIVSAMELAVQDIETAIEGKEGSVETIDTILLKEQEAMNALGALLINGEPNDLAPEEIRKSKIKIRQAIMLQRLAKRVLDMSVDRLEDALEILVGGDEQQGLSDEGNRAAKAGFGRKRRD